MDPKPDGVATRTQLEVNLGVPDSSCGSKQQHAWTQTDGIPLSYYPTPDNVDPDASMWTPNRTTWLPGHSDLFSLSFTSTANTPTDALPDLTLGRC